MAFPFCLGVEAVCDSFEWFSELVAARGPDFVRVVAEFVGYGVRLGGGELEGEK